MKHRTTVYPGFRYIQSRGGIKEFELKNNKLRVLLYKDTSFPVVALTVTYRIGARFERKGYTGATHYLEHLLFKGSKKYNKKNGKLFDRVMQSRGAKINATTSFDRTNYYEFLPMEHLEEAIRYEGDRMRNALFTEKDKVTEMAVVRNEYERGENDPNEALEKKILEEMFKVHPYRYAIIGLREDIERVPRARLKAFYDSFYHPNNAYVSIVGNFEERDVMMAIKKYFGVHKAVTITPPEIETEKDQNKERRVVLKRSTGAPIVVFAYRLKGVSGIDATSLDAVASILGGGQTSRLHRALVDRGTAVRVHASAYPLLDHSLFFISVTLSPNGNPKDVEKVIKSEIAKFIRNGASKKEVEIYKEKSLADCAFSRDGYLSISGELTEAISLGDWTRYVRRESEIRACSARVIKSAAKSALSNQNVTIGILETQKQS